MAGLVLDREAWAEEQFGGVQLGDRRRARRLVRLAAQMAADPSGSIPRQTETWSDTKAAYDLFDRESVTFEAVCQPHWNLRHEAGPGRFLILGDTTEIDFGKSAARAGLGPLGNGSGCGLLLHSALLVDAERGVLHSIAGAEVICRRIKPPGREPSAQRLARARESQRWGRLVDTIGRPPAATTWIPVMDREADNFEVFGHCQAQRSEWVIRARTLSRRLLPAGGQAPSLREFLRELPLAGSLQLKVVGKARTRNSKARGGRLATLEVRYGALRMPPPRQQSPYLKQLPAQALSMNVVWVREINPPPGEAAVEWVLYTSLDVTSLEEALVVIGYYRRRWLIEEWHKALKTGTRVTERQLETADRLKPLIGLLSVEALRLVQMKHLAASEPDCPATQVAPQLYVRVLRKALRVSDKRPEWTIRQFVRALARLGGFLARKRDGEPGWQTLWHGWEKLTLILRGHDLATSEKPKCR